MKSLDLNQFPLDGLALIEASAGTGKTYTLANLYLRYLLERRFSVDQILVVTFTEAATQELKDRIRHRIGELIVVFEHEGQGDFDPTLLVMFEKSQAKELDLILLKVAERQIDLAEIYTIHGFCQRMLKEYALDSLLPLEQTLVEDLTPHIRQVVEDFWRRQVLALPASAVAYVYQNWAEPESLMAALRPLMSRRPECIYPEVNGEGLDDWLVEFDQSKRWFQNLKVEVRLHLPEVIELISKAPLKRLNDKLKWLEIIRVWCEDESINFQFPLRSGKNNALEEFTPSKLELQTKTKHQPPEHNLFSYLEQTLESAPAALDKSFLVYSYQQITRDIEATKDRGGLLGFDDLILKLAQALEISSGQKSNQALQLMQRIRQRYGMALIDEFQDTDKSQYGIFSTLFGPLAGEQAKGLVLIGDPKQAIYAFRGGDIATYLHAKREVQAHPAGQLFTMATNWRSDPKMIAAVNALFEHVANPFMAQDIPFHAVDAGKAPVERRYAALHITQLDVAQQGDKPLKKEQVAQGLANHCVALVCELLAEGGSFCSADLAILVRSASEAELIKRCLAEAGVSASFEGKQSIYETEEAFAISLLMQAVSEHGNERALRRCLAEPFFGFDDAMLARLNSDVMFLGECFSLMDDLHSLWGSKGVIAMIREAMVRLEVFNHWQKMGLSEASNQWERRLSNINQLAEILQQQARVYRQTTALTRWFEQQLTQDHAVDDENRLRLESDEQLVRIVTIHKSKGLEYPVVFLPFLFSTRGADEAWFYDDQGRLCADLNKAEENISKAERERLAEDMRLLYVALTRSKYHCFVGTSAYKSTNAKSYGLAQTAWGYLCARGQLDGFDDDTLYADLQLLADQSNGVIELERKALTSIGHSRVIVPQGYNEESLPPEVRQLQRNLHSLWRVTSFTGLLQEDEHLSSHSSHGSHWIARSGDELPEGLNILTFPKGSRAGTFLHTLFESVVLSEGELLPRLKQRYSSLVEFIRRQLEVNQLVPEAEIAQWAEYLQDWLRRVLQMPLGQGFALADLGEKGYVSEMTFHFSVNDLSADRFNGLLSAHSNNAALLFSRIEGHLKGAIDLVLEASGRFYVLDYKSNFLGLCAQDYQHEAMQLAMDEHRYDVQYVLYTLALHRYLRHRMGEAYSYEAHMGGVIYLFLRGLGLEGVENQELPGVYFTKVPKALIDALDEEMAHS